jgi:protein-S-isoprenylcysteine O-methyltransferase Ste14
MQPDVKRYRPPRVILVLGVVLLYGFFDVAAPIAVSLFAPRRGWDGLRPGPLNVIGAALLAAGAVVVIRALADHGKAVRARDWDVVKIDPDHLLTPEYLIVDGVYAYSRNPLYLGDITMWIGWAVLLGSLPVAIDAGLLIVALLIGVRLEERGLAKQFGERWSDYARDVPRFLGRRRRTG